MLKRLLLAVTLVTAVASYATVNITVNVKSVAATVPTSSVTVRFSLQNCTLGNPRIIGSGNLSQTSWDFKPNASGVATGTIYGNDEIDCGGYQNSVYSLQYLVNGIPIQKAFSYVICAGNGGSCSSTGGAFDPSSTAPIISVPVVVPPSGDNTYLRVDGGNSGSVGTLSLGTLTAKQLNGEMNAAILGWSVAVNTGAPVYVPANSTIAISSTSLGSGQTIRCGSPSTSILTVAAGVTGISATSDRNKIDGCAFQVNGNNPVAIDLASFNRGTITNNKFYTGTTGTGQIGIRIHSGQVTSNYYNTISGNVFTITNGRGIQMYDTANGWNITGNTFTGNGVGFEIDGGVKSTDGTASSINAIQFHHNWVEGDSIAGVVIGCGLNGTALSGGVYAGATLTPGAVVYNLSMYSNRMEEHSGGIYQWYTCPQAVGTVAENDFITGGASYADFGLRTRITEDRSFAGGLNSTTTHVFVQNLNVRPNDGGTAEIAVTAGVKYRTFVPSVAYPYLYSYWVPTTPNGHAYQVSSCTGNCVAGTEPTWPTNGSSVTTGNVTFTDDGFAEQNAQVCVGSYMLGDIGCLVKQNNTQDYGLLDNGSSTFRVGTYGGNLTTPGIDTVISGASGSAGVVKVGRNSTGGLCVENNDTTCHAAITGAGAISGSSLLVTGTLDGVAPVTIVTSATFSIGSTFNTGYYLNQNATAATAETGTLPTAAAGKQYCVKNSYNGSAADTGTLKVQTSASGQFIIATGAISASGGYIISAGAAGESACFVGIDATHWEAYVQAGSWTLH